MIARVIDGDTVALTNGKKVRLVQIDTPEVGGGECFSQASRKALLRLTPVGSTVLLEADPTLDNVDRYGRLLRYIKRKGINVNIRLVLDGAAAPYFYRSEKGRYAERLVAAVTQAKAAKRGLWGACPGTQLAMTAPLQTRQGRSAPPPPATNPGSGNCHPSYRGACLDPNAYDYDCAGGVETARCTPAVWRLLARTISASTVTGTVRVARMTNRDPRRPRPVGRSRDA